MLRLLVFVLGSSFLLSAQEQTHFFFPVPHGGQQLRGAAIAGAGAIGLVTRKQGSALVVKSVVTGGPAERAGLKAGDLIVAVDGKSAADWSLDQLSEAVRRNPGETVKVTFARGQDGEAEATITAMKITDLYPDASKEIGFKPGLTQWLSENLGVNAILAQEAGHQSAVTLWLEVFNRPDGAVFNLDAGKFFVLDSQGRQLSQFTGAQAKYVVQQWLAQNWRGGSYVAPPPPTQRTYTIRGTENGNYTIQNLGGGMSTVTGTSNGNYTVTQEPDYGQLGASLGLSIRQWRDRKHDKKLLEDAQKQIAAIDQYTFKQEGPLLPGETRSGGIVFWSGTNTSVMPPFKVIMFIPDPTSSVEKPITFEFK